MEPTKPITISKEQARVIERRIRPLVVRAITFDLDLSAAAQSCYLQGMLDAMTLNSMGRLPAIDPQSEPHPPSSVAS